MDADIDHLPGFIPSPDRDRLLVDLIGTTAWREDTFKIYGREVPVPRLIAWYGDPGREYGYSKIVMAPVPWTPALLDVKARVESAAGAGFNSVLLNYYRDGRDSVSWHSDDEPELGPAPVIGSVSFGATRKFQLRHRADRGRRYALDLTHGSLLVMRGPTQRCWQHQVPKTARAVGPRVNLTFRTIV
jgi:alkylated DNA repair dioxygenase AlkB